MSQSGASLNDVGRKKERKWTAHMQFLHNGKATEGFGVNSLCKDQSQSQAADMLATVDDLIAADNNDGELPDLDDTWQGQR